MFPEPPIIIFSFPENLSEISLAKFKSFSKEVKFGYVEDVLPESTKYPIPLQITGSELAKK